MFLQSINYHFSSDIVNFCLAMVTAYLSVKIFFRFTLEKFALWFLLFRGVIQKGLQEAGFADQANFLDSDLPRILVCLIIIWLIETSDEEDKYLIMPNKFSKWLETNINKYSPTIETLVIQAGLTVLDGVVLYIGNGQDYDLVGIQHAAGTALGSFITSTYRSKRASILTKAVSTIVNNPNTPIIVTTQEPVVTDITVTNGTNVQTVKDGEANDNGSK